MNVKDAFQTDKFKSASTKLIRRHSLFKVASKQPFIQHLKSVISLKNKPSHVRIDKEYDIKYETSPRRKKQLLVRARTRCSLSRTPERQLNFEVKGCMSSRNAPGPIDFESKSSSKSLKSFAKLIAQSSNLHTTEKENTASITQKLVLHKSRIPSSDGSLFTTTEMKRAVEDFQSNFYNHKMVSSLRRKRKQAKSPIGLQ
mmetsp:Transcript_34586/g.60725  ORF Transcript_34586/g.60725 Transcript_34586/m.60725 type:complete len:200 (-) Transcript_34586:1113-1712(-)